MEKLNDCITNATVLAKALKKNGKSHKSYKSYMSMERALGFLLSGDLFLFDGSNWNDMDDIRKMEGKKVFGKSFSYSTCENVAMWMLYGDQGGKKGAMLDFLPSVRDEIIKTQIIDIGIFTEKGKFKKFETLNAEKNEFEIFFTDMLYYEELSNGKVRLTLADEHCTTQDKVLNHPDIFCKEYPWAYEKECRLVVKLSEEWANRIKRENLYVTRIKVSEKSLNKMRNNRLIRSPIYENGVENGVPSTLTGDVKWDK